MIIQRLSKSGLISPPKWLIDNVSFLGYSGSVAYGASSDTSDMDCFGFCIPPKHLIFPYSVGGEIVGFGRQQERFRVWSEHHIDVPGERKVYDFSIYNIVDFFNLAMENNPNVLDVLFLPRRCILHSTPIAEHVRTNRKLFLHKGSFHKYRGYMFAQMSKIRNKTNSSNPKRADLIEQHGFDTKFAMHVVRLALQAEQILVEHDLDLERNSEILKSIRRGEWTLEQIDEWAMNKERALELTYANSSLQHSPDQEKIKQVLIDCLTMHYGNLDQAVVRDTSMDRLLDDLRSIMDRYDRQGTQPCS
jgi:predicted nucleotidyltransferase